jgi:hypothetical protein
MVNVRFIYFIFLVSLHCTALAEKAEKANADVDSVFFFSVPVEPGRAVQG